MIRLVAPLLRRSLTTRTRAGRCWSVGIAVALVLAATNLAAQPATPRSVLVIYEPGPSRTDTGLGDARQLRQLLGHFATEVTLQPMDEYRGGSLERFDVGFFVGFTRGCTPPHQLLEDISRRDRTFAWLGWGLAAYGERFDLPARYGFRVTGVDTAAGLDTVEAAGNRFTKTDSNATLLQVTDPARASVLATASSSRTRRTVPYLLRSGAFWCVIDSPFSYATENDRYLYFADLLHDILGEDHPPSHSAIIRIEDTNPTSDPARLRAIADLLHERGVPFLVGVTPFYVNPASGTRIPMSDTPDYVDALRYMAGHGGTVVMHGTTHQFKGETTSDYEFWDESRDRPLPADSRELVNQRLHEGIVELQRNGVYPLLWETPHYSATEVDYAAVAEHFGSAIEQRLVLDRLDFSQYFPYVIRKDMYGQRIYPENLGYIPLDPDIEAGRRQVDRLLSFAQANLAVRDGFASCFFHPFVNLSLLERLVDGIRALGFTYVDLRDDPQWVAFPDRAIVCGERTVSLRLEDQYLYETTVDESGRVVRRDISDQRIAGVVRREVKLPPRSIYAAEPREYRERPRTWWEQARRTADEAWQHLVAGEERHLPARAMLLTDATASGSALDDQESLAAPLLALNMPVQRVEVHAETALAPAEANLVLVPNNVAQTLSQAQLDALKEWVEQGGNLVTDFRNPVAEALGVRFLPSRLSIERVRDRLFPEEVLRWAQAEVMTKFDTADSDEVLAVDDVTGIPVVISRQVGDGRLLFFGTRFDPTSTGGFGRFPYLANYLRHTMGLTPLLRREQLEMYFDPGFRRNVSIEVLVTRWAEAGVRVIHAGGWHEYPKYTYDYARLIRLCHANGILVYAWLEPPQVSKMFWQEHPEWREKNYRGEDFKPEVTSWRYPVALTDPACLKAALQHYRKLLNEFDWDGVNIGELYFEGGRTLGDAAAITPLHSSAREEFRRLHGFDPASLFNPTSTHFWRYDRAGAQAFLHYRVGKVTQLHDTLLDMVDSVRANRPGFGVIVTVLDSLSAPELKSTIGVDTASIAALLKRHRFVLQVEDPASMWSQDPRRYEAIAARYAAMLRPQDLALDLNILTFRDERTITPFPTRIQTGAESACLVASAARGAPRVTIYSESSANPQDVSTFASAYVVGTNVVWNERGLEIETPHTLVLDLGSSVDDVDLDGARAHTIGDGRFLVPAGSHLVNEVSRPLDAVEPDVPETHLLSITGELLHEESSLRSVSFGYRSEERCIVTVTREPYAVLLDGKEVRFAALKGNGRAGLVLPPGEHEALVVTESTVSYGVDVTSLWSSYLIAVFGVLSTGLLLALWVTVRLRHGLARTSHHAATAAADPPARTALLGRRRLRRTGSTPRRRLPMNHRPDRHFGRLATRRGETSRLGRAR